MKLEKLIEQLNILIQERELAAQKFHQYVGAIAILEEQIKMMSEQDARPLVLVDKPKVAKKKEIINHG